MARNVYGGSHFPGFQLYGGDLSGGQRVDDQRIDPITTSRYLHKERNRRGDPGAVADYRRTPRLEKEAEAVRAGLQTGAFNWYENDYSPSSVPLPQSLTGGRVGGGPGGGGGATAGSKYWGLFDAAAAQAGRTKSFIDRTYSEDFFSGLDSAVPGWQRIQRNLGSTARSVASRAARIARNDVPEELMLEAGGMSTARNRRAGRYGPAADLADINVRESTAQAFRNQAGQLGMQAMQLLAGMREQFTAPVADVAPLYQGTLGTMLQMEGMADKPMPTPKLSGGGGGGGRQKEDNEVTDDTLKLFEELNDFDPMENEQDYLDMLNENFDDVVGGGAQKIRDAWDNLTIKDPFADDDDDETPSDSGTSDTGTSDSTTTATSD